MKPFAAHGTKIVSTTLFTPLCRWRRRRRRRWRRRRLLLVLCVPCLLVLQRGHHLLCAIQQWRLHLQHTMAPASVSRSLSWHPRLHCTPVSLSLYILPAPPRVFNSPSYIHYHLTFLSPLSMRRFLLLHPHHTTPHPPPPPPPPSNPPPPRPGFVYYLPQATLYLQPPWSLSLPRARMCVRACVQGAVRPAKRSFLWAKKHHKHGYIYS